MAGSDKAISAESVFVHHLSDVQSTNIGSGTNIWQFCVVLAGAKIGKNCNICSHCFIENDVRVGDSVTVKNGVHLWDGVVLEDDVFVGPNVVFTNDQYPRSKSHIRKLRRTMVLKGASIGGGAVLIPGITIGEYAMVAAGAVVTKDVAPFTLVAGMPAKFVRYISELDFDTCDFSG